MHWFADELKKAREARNIRLLTVASATKISLNVLNALECGNYSLLPYPYMRAFVVEYASYIGLNTADTVQRFDRAIQEIRERIDAERLALGQAEDGETLIQVSRRMLNDLRLWLTENIPQVFITSLGVFVFIILSWLFLHSFRHDSVETSVREVPFQQVLKESERAAAAFSKSGFRFSPEEKGVKTSVDSLILRATTTDSVWMAIAIDGSDTSKYLFGPSESKTWKASEGFSITLGNAGGMSFTLNDQSIGSLGKPGAVVRDVQLTRRDLTDQE
ncbi:MAG: RodZ domain-containing protein [Bacteroidota bacterium]